MFPLPATAGVLSGTDAVQPVSILHPRTHLSKPEPGHHYLWPPIPKTRQNSYLTGDLTHAYPCDKVAVP